MEHNANRRMQLSLSLSVLSALIILVYACVNATHGKGIVSESGISNAGGTEAKAHANDKTPDAVGSNSVKLGTCAK